MKIHRLILAPAGTLAFTAASWVVMLLTPAALSAQQAPEIEMEVDTASIRIGEQILCTLKVVADSSALVIFPDGQTFAPLETVEAYRTDTTRRDARLELIKTYALTQFDSGAYLLPSQRVEVDGKGYFTDSLLISVATVPVDTTQQKLYDIKPLQELEAGIPGWLKWLGWGALFLLIAGGLYYWFVLREKPLSPEEEEALLPPYERAILSLEKLEESRYLIQDEYKAYYSELTNIVRAYLEEEVEIDALESTTSELISKLELLRDAGRLNLQPDTIIKFRRILETADLVKFARSRPQMRQAEADRQAMREVVSNTHEAIPEPTEEELMEQEAYQEALLQEKRRKRIWIAAASLAGLILIGGIGAVSYYGLSQVRETLFGSPTKSLMEGEWIASSYGFPPILLETPEVLYRKETALPEAARENIRDMDVFSYNNPKARFSITARSITLADPQAEPDFEQSIEEVLQQFEKQGARNLITKQEAFETASGVKGVRVYGSGRFSIPDSSEDIQGGYTVLVFGGKGFMQQIILSWEEDDRYSDAIVARILRNLDVKLTI